MRDRDAVIAFICRLHRSQAASRKIKAWNRNVYYTRKYSMMTLILALIVTSTLR